MLDQNTTLADEILFGDNHVDFWVFAYGSLMWRPGFPFIEREAAVLEGYSRSLCIYSWVHRGTRETPGLVFGLDEGGACEGFAYRIAPEHRRDTVEILRARELVTGVYREVLGPVTLKGARATMVKALFYAAVCDHEQYAGSLTESEQLRLVRQGVGQSGINSDYVLNTFAHLSKEGIRDDALAALCAAISARS
ncbi:MAG: gamma-glutamylcyclotransferase [Rhizobiales bacterium]|nr:gamma-glutamylcyclotransferase [Hyphomicrobiales bacterium]